MTQKKKTIVIDTNIIVSNFNTKYEYSRNKLQIRTQEEAIIREALRKYQKENNVRISAFKLANKNGKVVIIPQVIKELKDGEKKRIADVNKKIQEYVKGKEYKGQIRPPTQEDLDRYDVSGKDKKVLYESIQVGADIILTADKKFAKKNNKCPIEIMTPMTYFEKYSKKKKH